MALEGWCAGPFLADSRYAGYCGRTCGACGPAPTRFRAPEAAGEALWLGRRRASGREAVQGWPPGGGGGVGARGRVGEALAGRLRGSSQLARMNALFRRVLAKPPTSRSRVTGCARRGSLVDTVIKSYDIGLSEMVRAAARLRGGPERVASGRSARPCSRRSSIAAPGPWAGPSWRAPRSPPGRTARSACG